MSKFNKSNLSVSQNFLTSRIIIDRLIRISGITKDDNVLEIGAGKGHITRVLADKCKSVTAVELDTKLYGRLCGIFADNSNVKLLNIDFLNYRVPKYEYKVFSNIPFSITTDIIRKLTQSDNPPVDTWLVMEKGAAKRFMGKPYDSIQSLLLKPFYDLEIKYYFNRNDFHPSPSVDTVLLRISKKTNPDIDFLCRKIYYDFTSHSHFIPRSGDTLYVQWLCLFRRYMEINKI